MNTITIYGSDGSIVIADLKVDDTSYRNRAIMSDDSVTLYYSLAEHVEIPVGSYIEFQNVRYTLMRPEAFKKKHSRNFEYTVTLESDIAKAKIWKFRNTVDGRLKFSLTAQPWEHLQMFVDNMNQRDPDGSFTWYFNRDDGDCVEGVETLINYDHAYCWDALGQMADTFGTEFDVAFEKDSDGTVLKHVMLKKLEYNKSRALRLAYGKGNGFLPNVGRSNYGDNPPVEFLYTQGGDTNIDRSKYGNSELLLPKSAGGVMKTLQYDGEHFEDEAGFDETNARTYVTDDQGFYIRRVDSEAQIVSHAEQSLDCSEIYPKRVGTVSDVIHDEKNDLWDFVDDSIPEDLNFEDYLIAGETMTVIFQSGELSGREFEVQYVHESKAGKQARRFEIISEEIDGETMPNEIFKPAVGDTYAVFNCYLPDEYIADDETKTGAEWEMFRAAVQYFYENEEQLYTFTGEIDPFWLKNTYAGESTYFRLGGYVEFDDDNFKGVVRITAVKDYINKPYKLELTLSNGIVTPGFTTSLVQIESESVAVDESYRNAVDYTKRRWRDTQETMTMLEEAFTNFSASIAPVTVQTMQLIAGDEGLQFQFIKSLTDHTRVDDDIYWDNNSKQLRVGGNQRETFLQHLTLNIDYISSQIDDDDHPIWTMDPFESAVLDDGTKSYYLYARCRRYGSSMVGTYVLSETPIGMEEQPAYYHFLVGILNSEYEDERSFVTLYGFTEILPGRITTDRVVSGDGESYFDMVNNAMKLGDALDFNSKGDGTLRLKGTIVQSQSGDENYLGCFRGAWDATTTYFQGDEVTYSSNDITSTYRCIKLAPGATSSSDIIYPTNTSYWQVISQGGQGNKGDTGDTGNFTEIRYAVNGSTTAGPDIIDPTALIPTYLDENGTMQEWSTQYPAVPSGSYLWQISAMKSGDSTRLITSWSGPVRITPYNGTDGSSPVLVYRGEYDSTKVYYGTSDRRDAVHYNSTYYVARTDAGDFINIEPTQTSKWNAFGASFESIATGLLLAEGASIGDWFVSEGQIVSTLQSGGNKIALDAGKDAGVPKIKVQSAGNGYVLIDGEEAEIDAWTSSTSGNGASISAKGFFTNRAYQNSITGTTGRTVLSGMCVNASGEVAKSEDSEFGNFLAGVYASVSNNGNAPSFGANIERLRAVGLVLGVSLIEADGVVLSETDTMVIGMSSSARYNVYLPSNAVTGQTILFRQMGSGYLVVNPGTDNDMLWGFDTIDSRQYSMGEGAGVMACAIRRTDGTDGYIWVLSAFSRMT